MTLRAANCNAFILFVVLFAILGLLCSQTTSAAKSAGASARTLTELVACSHGTKFGAARQFPGFRNPENILAGDFNNDGTLDLAISNASVLASGQVSIFAGNGQGEFANVYNIQLQSFPSRLASGDFNNDGKLDLVTSIPGDNSGVVVSLGQGDWTFATTVISSFAIRYQAGVAVSDFNADGKADIAFSGEGKMNLLIGKGDGTFTRAESYAVSSLPGSLVAGDFNGDDKTDLIVFGELYDATSTLFINEGAGRFRTGETLSLRGGGGVLTNAVGDLNGDGKADLAFVRLTDAQERGVTVLFSNGAGGFGEPLQIPLFAIGSPRALLIADVNGDNKPDLVATEDFSNRVTVLLGNGAGAFSVNASYSVGYAPLASAAGDFDRDGKPDIAVVSFDQTLSILTGLGEGRFLAPRGLDLADKRLRATVLADINKDERPDAVVALGNAGGVLIALGDGVGGFESSKTYPVGRDGNDLAVADFNKDGFPDIVVVSGNSFDLQTGSVRVLFGGASGDFTLDSRNLNAGQTPSTVVSADFNRDGNPDLAVGNFVSNDVSILLGDGRGGFATAVNVPVGASPSAFALNDYNNDGRLDIAVTNYGGASLSILRGDGAGGFTSTSLGVPALPLSLVAADFNSDGNGDLAVIHRDESAQRNLSLLLGNGDASFRPPVRFVTGNFPASVTAGDFTGDGKTDLALTEPLIFSSSGSTNYVNVYASDGAGNFALSSRVPVPEAVYLTSGDLNRDGIPDLAVATQKGLVSVLGICNPPLVNAVASVSAASYKAALAPESIASAFGVGLATSTVSATTLPLPTNLAGTSVRVKDVSGTERLAPLFFVSPFQINYLIPAGTASGLATITVTNRSGQTSTGSVFVTPTAPGIFTANADGVGPPAGYLLRVKASGAQSAEPLAEFDSVQNRYIPRPIDFYSDSTTVPDRIFLVLFGTGLRQRAVLADVTVGFNLIPAQVLYAGPQGDFVGLDQINLELPQARSITIADLVVVVDGKPSNMLRIAFVFRSTLQ